MKTFRIETIQKTISRKVYYIDANSEIEARREWNATVYDYPMEYLNDDNIEQGDEAISLVIETDSDGNDLQSGKML